MLFDCNSVEIMRMGATSGVVFNIGGNPLLDFTIEGDNDQSLFFVDSSADKVAIGTSTVGSALLTVDGDITATGILANITASGALSASLINGAGTGTTQLNVAGQITASGNISSSGDIIANRFVGTIATAAQPNITSVGTLTSLTAGTLRLTSTTDASATSTGHAFQSGPTSGANIIINSNEVMARNNGAVAALYLNPDGGVVAFQNSEANSVQIDHGQITASSNISSSGTIIANEIDVRGHITASGDISSSGDLTANALYGPLEYWEATARADCDNDTNWQGPNNYGIISRADWNQDYGTDYDDTSAVVEESRLYWNTGWRVPPDCSASIEGFDIYLNANDGPDAGGSNPYDTDFGFSCSLWYSNPDDFSINHWDGGNSPAPPAGGSNGKFNLRHAGTVTDAQIPQSGQLFKYNMLHVSQSFTPIGIAPGGMVYPRIKTTSTSEGIMVVYWMVKYRKIKA